MSQQLAGRLYPPARSHDHDCYATIVVEMGFPADVVSEVQRLQREATAPRSQGYDQIQDLMNAVMAYQQRRTDDGGV